MKKFIGVGVALVGVVLALAGVGICAAQFMGGGSPGKLDLKMEVKPTVMTVAYKAYGNAEAADGKYWLAKLVMRNTGGSPLENMEVSYRVPGHIDWTTPDTAAEVLQGQTLVMPIYPRFTSEVTKTRTRTPAQIEVKIAYTTAGKAISFVEKRPFELRGITEIEFTSIEADEILGWYDMWDNSEVLAAYMTDEDDVVKAYFGKISETMGGTPYVSNSADLGKLLAAIYNFQVGTGMVYMGAKGVPEKLGDTQTLVQSIKLPRDVIRGNSGTCIELSILMSALLNQCGVKSHMVLVPGHAFPLIEGPGGTINAFECTGIGGQALGYVNTFEEALQRGNDLWAKCLKGEMPYVVVDYQDYQSKGLRPPELERVDITQMLQMLNDRIDRRVSAAQARQQAQQQPQQNQQPQTQQPQTQPEMQPQHQVVDARDDDARVPNPALANFYRDPTGMMTIRYPAGWLTDPAVVANLQQNGAPWYLYFAADPQTTWEFSAFGFGSGDQNACAEALFELGDALGLDMVAGDAQQTQINGLQWTQVPLSYEDPNGVPYIAQLYMHTIGNVTYGFGVSGPKETARAANEKINLIIQNVTLKGQ